MKGLNRDAVQVAPVQRKQQGELDGFHFSNLSFHAGET